MSTSLNGLDNHRRVASLTCRGVQTDLDLDSLADDEIADAIPDLLADYSAECKDWTVVAGEHWRQERWARAEQVLQSGIRCECSCLTFGL